MKRSAASFPMGTVSTAMSGSAFTPDMKPGAFLRAEPTRSSTSMLLTNTTGTRAQRAYVPGQAAVVYDADTVICGGTIR